MQKPEKIHLPKVYKKLETKKRMAAILDQIPVGKRVHKELYKKREARVDDPAAQSIFSRHESIAGMMHRDMDFERHECLQVDMDFDFERHA